MKHEDEDDEDEQESDEDVNRYARFGNCFMHVNG
jgi:hypothetical protein